MTIKEREHGNDMGDGQWVNQNCVERMRRSTASLLHSVERNPYLKYRFTINKLKRGGKWVHLRLYIQLVGYNMMQ